MKSIVGEIYKFKFQMVQSLDRDIFLAWNFPPSLASHMKPLPCSMDVAALNFPPFFGFTYETIIWQWF